VVGIVGLFLFVLQNRVFVVSFFSTHGDPQLLARGGENNGNNGNNDNNGMTTTGRPS
jgi:hypothetical protein